MKNSSAESNELERMNPGSLDIGYEQRQKLKELFPEVFTEGDKIDFERLKATLGEDIDAGRERYGLSWPGKADCFKTIQRPSVATLKPDREQSVNFHETENLFIEGDNLEVLKLLQKSYSGKVKMIYIDPPYNTGKEFIYPDNFTESLDTYLQYTGQIDEEGRKFSTNTDTDGRFHSKWLNMMYPRLFLARNLLREDGVIFISIDDNEVANLRKICDEVFGEENHLGTIIWENATDNNPTNIAVEHEYIICYSRDRSTIEGIWKSPESDVKRIMLTIERELIEKYQDQVLLQEEYSRWLRAHKDSLSPLDRYRYIDQDGIYTGSQSVHNPGREGYRYDIIHPKTGKPCKQPLMGYRFPETTMRKLIDDGKILFGDDENKIIELKLYAKEFLSKLGSVVKIDGRLGAYDLKRYFTELTATFSNPKPVRLLEYLFSFVSHSEDDLILDFFAGSCTTAEAIIQLNIQNGFNRKFLVIQLPELCYEDRKNSEFSTIADIGKERIRRVIKKIKEEQEAKAPTLFDQDEPKKLDLGFKVFKLDRSNFKLWDCNPDKRDAKELAKQLELHVDHIKEGASKEEILYELLLKSGFSLTDTIREQKIGGGSVYLVSDGALVICLEKKLTTEILDAIAEIEPQRVIFLDRAFEDQDQLKANAIHTLKAKNPDVVIRTV